MRYLDIIQETQKTEKLGFSYLIMVMLFQKIIIIVKLRIAIMKMKIQTMILIIIRKLVHIITMLKIN